MRVMLFLKTFRAAAAASVVAVISSCGSLGSGPDHIAGNYYLWSAASVQYEILYEVQHRKITYERSKGVKWVQSHDGWRRIAGPRVAAFTVRDGCILARVVAPDNPRVVLEFVAIDVATDSVHRFEDRTGFLVFLHERNIKWPAEQI